MSYIFDRPERGFSNFAPAWTNDDGGQASWEMRFYYPGGSPAIYRCCGGFVGTGDAFLLQAEKNSRLVEVWDAYPAVHGLASPKMREKVEFSRAWNQAVRTGDQATLDRLHHERDVATYSGGGIGGVVGSVVGAVSGAVSGVGGAVSTVTKPIAGALPAKSTLVGKAGSYVAKSVSSPKEILRTAAAIAIAPIVAPVTVPLHVAGSLAGSNTIARKLKDRIVSDPILERATVVGETAAIVGVVATGGFVAGGGSIGTGAAGMTAPAIPTAITATATKAATGLATAYGTKLAKDAGILPSTPKSPGGGGGGSSPGGDTTIIVQGGGGPDLTALLAGAGVGFLAAGPVGGVAGAAAAYFMKRDSGGNMGFITFGNFDFDGFTFGNFDFDGFGADVSAGWKTGGGAAAPSIINPGDLRPRLPGGGLAPALPTGTPTPTAPPATSTPVGSTMGPNLESGINDRARQMLIEGSPSGSTPVGQTIERRGSRMDPLGTGAGFAADGKYYATGAERDAATAAWRAMHGYKPRTGDETILGLLTGGGPSIFTNPYPGGTTSAQLPTASTSPPATSTPVNVTLPAAPPALVTDGASGSGGGAGMLVAGGIVGFLLGGPLGAAAGAGLGAALGKK